MKQDHSTNETGEDTFRPSLIAARRLCREYDVVPSTLWRWQQRGWLPQPTYLGRRPYYPSSAIRELEERAQRGEFASDSKPPRKGGQGR